MLPIGIFDRGRPARVLCLGAHSDDIEIGAGGTLLSWIASGGALEVTWCVASAAGARGDEATRSAYAFLEGAAAIELVLGDFRDGYLPAERARLKDWVETLKRDGGPDIILTHTDDDSHQDHRLIRELTWNTFRDHLILEYEIPKWDGDLGRANAYVALGESLLERKIELLLEHFATQRSKDWFDAGTFRGLARLRGLECRSRYAEAFRARKLLLA